VRVQEDLFGELLPRILDLIRRGVHDPIPDSEFNGIALEVFRFQCRTNGAYGAFVARRGIDPGGVERWEEVPPLPTRAFKSAPLMAGDPARAEAVFRTSGTTRGAEERGQHFIRSLHLYREALLPNFRTHLLPDGEALRVLALVPDPKVVPDSSLSFMIGEVIEAVSEGRGEFFVDPEKGLGAEAFAAALTEAEEEGDPILIAGTALALSHWLDLAEEEGWRYSLPDDSRIMETGGYKGSRRSLGKVEFYAGLAQGFGVTTSRIVNEYGMTELLSQFYEPVLVDSEGPNALSTGAPRASTEVGLTSLSERYHRGPPWTNTRVLHPLTLEPVPEGNVGILAHLDLANLGSVAAILTEDLGVSVPGGFRLLGRSPEAEPRGCSLAMDEFLAAVKGDFDAF
jgi:hypothetical protein